MSGESTSLLTLILSPARSVNVREVSVTQYRISHCEHVLRARSGVIHRAHERGQRPHGFLITARQVVRPPDDRRTLGNHIAGKYRAFVDGTQEATRGKNHAKRDSSGVQQSVFRFVTTVEGEVW